jgi:hypothetical protein
MGKKEKSLLFLVVIFLFSVPFFSKASSCITYGQPFFHSMDQPNNILAYNCEEGVIKDLDIGKFLVSDVSGTDDLGSFIHKLVWSPDGENVAILAENVSPAIRNLKLFSSDKNDGELLWWIYNLKSHQAAILPDGILSIGWLDGNNLVYNFQNTEIRKININNVGQPVKLISPLKGKNNLEDDLVPAMLGENMIFPLDHGFYVINKSNGNAEFKAIDKIIKGISVDYFSSNVFAIETDADFRIYGNNAEILKINQIFSHPVFVSSNLILGVKNDGAVYSFDEAQKKFEKYAPFKISNPAYLYSANGEADLFAITAEGNVYYLKNGELKIFSDKPAPDANNQSNAIGNGNSAAGKNNIWIYFAIVVTSLILSIAYINWKIRRYNK